MKVEVRLPRPASALLAAAIGKRPDDLVARGRPLGLGAPPPRRPEVASEVAKVGAEVLREVSSLNLGPVAVLINPPTVTLRHPDQVSAAPIEA